MENTFGIAIIPDNEEERLDKLRSLHLLDTHREEGTFKHIAAMAARMFDVPIAMVNLVASEHVHTKGSAGMAEPLSLVPRGISLCSLAVLREETTVFQNALEEPCLLANPLVSGEFGLRFYAAAPLTTNDGYTIGAICLVDKEPRKFPETDQRVLENLASVVMENIERGTT
ncbi:GAF domain-containing protein [Rufibacter latericius]|uniref:GAF domain-containing protein n=1 Tax=Rufibacter latericius TaxID=2487040 RepID=A0A3M9N315_9BACT|nr:GAF domain-containing protein [Rufibacter latericius]RNI31418.1 GAF domain-containing protein [Rufibacter latericius]